MENEFIINDEVWAHELQHGVEDYTDMLFESLYASDEEEIPETLSGQPFCGCSNCFWREALFFITPKLLKGFQEGKLELEE